MALVYLAMMLLAMIILLGVAGVADARTGPKSIIRHGEVEDGLSNRAGLHSYGGRSSRYVDNSAGGGLVGRPHQTERVVYQQPPERVQNVLDQRRADRKLKDTSGDTSVNLDMDCGSMTGYPCQLYMQEYLNTYVYINRSYDRLILPVRNNAEKPIDVSIVVTFVDLVSVDTVGGTMTASIFIDYLWNDVFMTWNKSLTDNDGFILVPTEMLWIPDIIIYNAIGGFHSQIDAEAVFLSSDGEAWWSGRGVMTYACTFDVTDFPFDSHTCTTEFSSWVYSINNINISSVGVEVLESFDNLAWQVDSVTGRRQEMLLWNGAYRYTFGMFDVTVSRYYEHYINSAIFPSIIITSIVLSSLFMGDFGNRLSMAVTGLLTVIAIQWSVAAQLPVAKNSSWLGNFLSIAVGFIAITTVECYVSAVMAGRKHGNDVPNWVKYLIDISLFWEFWGPFKRTVLGRSGAGSGQETESGDVELKNAVDMETNPLSDADHGSSSDMKEQQEPRESGVFQNVRRSIFGEPSPPPPMEQPAIRYTWERGSRALDRISRFVLPTAYAALVVMWLVQKF